VQAEGEHWVVAAEYAAAAEEEDAAVAAAEDAAAEEEEEDAAVEGAVADNKIVKVLVEIDRSDIHLYRPFFVNFGIQKIKTREKLHCTLQYVTTSIKNTAYS
jgi:hypothetical protein